jgi:hypothetical protein
MLGHEIAFGDESAVMIDLITVVWMGSIGLGVELENAMDLGDGLGIKG